MYTAKMIAHARRVPWGMATLGFLRYWHQLQRGIYRGGSERERREGGRYGERDGARNYN